MSAAPLLSIVIPVKDGAAVLPRCLDGIRASGLPRETYEIIVVDDGSRDATAAIAREGADRVATVSGGPKGPAFARNQGADVARGAWLAFVDADVVVGPGTLSRLVDLISEEEGHVAAFFGAYDDRPDDSGFISQYRNLLHRWVHLQGAGEAHTFWAGLGAVRRDAFLAVGGFDPDRYPRPQIEDIDLGYRLGDAGYRIELRPELEGRHLKRWTFGDMVRTDLSCRAIPWMRLILERQAEGAPQGTLNLRRGEKLKTALVGVGLLLLAAGAGLGRWALVLLGLAVLVGVLLSNAALFAWYGRVRGFWFAFRVVPMNLLYYVINGVGAAVAIVQHRVSGPAERRDLRDGRPVEARSP